MTIIQLLTILFGVFFLIKVLISFKQENVSWRGLLFWGGLCLALIILAVSLQTVTTVFTWIGIKRPIELAIYMSIIVLFYLVFRIFVKIQELEEDITELVREIAKK